VRLALALAAALSLLPLARARAAPRVAELRAVLDDRQVLVSLTLRDGFDARLRERLQSGLPTTIVYELELLSDRKRWFDRPLERSELELEATFDALGGEYRVHTRLDDELVGTQALRSPAELEAVLTRVEGLPVFAVGERLVGQRLLVRARAVLGSRHVLGFIPARVISEWVESDKFRVRREP
jgi:hypothetical protein